MKVYWINELKDQLGMMARPRGGDWLEDDIKDLKRQKVSTIISLLQYHEETVLIIESEASICENAGIDFVSFPIEDRGVPLDENGYIQLIENIAKQLDENKKVVVHCRMGIGRTAVVCAGVLIFKGIDRDKVFDVLSKTRTLETPDTNEQIEWVLGNDKCKSLNTQY